MKYIGSNRDIVKEKRKREGGGRGGQRQHNRMKQGTSGCRVMYQGTE